jgi:gluconate 2-dehydrogenase gamma chain
MKKNEFLIEATNSEPRGYDRRTFLGLLAVITCSYPVATLSTVIPKADNSYFQSLTDPWLTLHAVQEHLFPSEEDSPGAKEIGALPFLRLVLESPGIEDEEKLFIRKGVTWLNDIAQNLKSKSFSGLEENDRELVLRKIVRSRAGERWLSLIMSYLIEALLSDPVYGGNVNQVGWSWLKHQPGFPRPSQDKMYFKLGKPIRRSTKA